MTLWHDISGRVIRAFLPRRVGRIGAEVLRRTQAFLGQERVAVVGCGRASLVHLDAFDRTGVSQVVAVCDVRLSALAETLDRLPHVRAYRDYRRMLREMHPDIVCVCADTVSHADLVIQAAAAGVKGILCEEPLALQMQEIEKMIAHCHRRHLHLAGSLPLRFTPTFVRAYRVIRAGLLGSVQAVKGWTTGPLYENGPRLMDAARFILGNPAPRSVVGHCTRSHGGSPADAEARVTGQVTFDSGMRFEVTAGNQVPSPLAVVVEGSEGMLEVTPDYLRLDPEIDVDALWVDPDHHVAQLREFIQWVKGRRPTNPADQLQAALAVEMTLGVYESARLGVPVELPLQNKGEIIRELFPDHCPVQPAPLTIAPVHGRTRRRDRLASEGGPRAVDRWFACDPHFGIGELAAVIKVVARGKLSAALGREVRSFESEFAQLFEAPGAVASMSGTSAIQCALSTLNLNPCDEVIVSPLADVDSTVAVLWSNCIPVFADVDPLTGNMTAQSLAARITPKTRAVILTHFLGRPAELGPICSLLRDRRIPLVEDCSHALYARYRGKPVGTFGECGCFSFSQSSPITAGEGGMTLINAKERADRAAMFVEKGGGPTPGQRYAFLGLNCRMTELQAAVLRTQLGKLPAIVERRRKIAVHLARRLRSIPGVILPVGLLDKLPTWSMVNFSIDETILGVSTDEFCDALCVEGVRVLRHYLPSPVFHCEVLNHQATYGTSRYPFTASTHKPPNLDDYPGFLEFHRRHLYIRWSSRVRRRHGEDIASAVKKVASHYQVAAQRKMVSMEIGTTLSNDQYAQAAP